MTVNNALILLGLKHVPFSEEELRDAYVIQARRWHPDRVAGRGGDVAKASHRMSLINEANVFLINLIRQRSQTRMGRYYKDTREGQHYRRDEFGYVEDKDTAHGVSSFVSSILSGIREHQRRGVAS